MATKYTINQVRQHPKTINRVFNARTRIDALTVGTADTDVIITTALTNRLVGEGYNGTNLPLQVSTGVSDYTGEGIVTGNIVDVFDSVTKDKVKITTAVGPEEIYGRITEATGIYTLSFFYLDVDGVEQPAEIGIDTIDFEFDYAYKFEDLPNDFATSVTSRNIEQDIKKGGATYVAEPLKASADNVLPDLAYTPVGNSTKVTFTGHTLFIANNDFTITDKTITLDPAVIGYDILAGENVVVEYFTLEK